MFGENVQTQSIDHCDCHCFNMCAGHFRIKTLSKQLFIIGFDFLFTLHIKHLSFRNSTQQQQLKKILTTTNIYFLLKCQHFVSGC